MKAREVVFAFQNFEIDYSVFKQLPGFENPFKRDDEKKILARQVNTLYFYETRDESRLYIPAM